LDYAARDKNADDDAIGSRLLQCDAVVRQSRSSSNARVIRFRWKAESAVGKISAAEIAEAVGISLPPVQNIKKALGLVSPR
jgi:hypothetical protein